MLSDRVLGRADCWFKSSTYIFNTGFLTAVQSQLLELVSAETLDNTDDPTLTVWWDMDFFGIERSVVEQFLEGKQ